MDRAQRRCRRASTVRALARVVPVLLLVAGFAAAPAEAAFPGKNGRIAFATGGEPGYGNEIYAMNPDGSEPARLTASAEDEYQLAWSPDGSMIAFTRYRLDGSAYEGDVFVMNADGTGQRNVTNNPGTYLSPSWSPDGARLVFGYASTTAPAWARDADIFTINLDGSGLTRLTSDGAGTTDLDPAWSPDGSRIVFARHGFEPGLYTMRPDGTDTRKLIEASGPRPRIEHSPSWSPDGTRIVFGAGGGGLSLSSNLHTVRADGTGERPLTEGFSVVHGDPAWSPDGTRIVFFSFALDLGVEFPDLNLFTIGADGTGLTQLTGLDSPPGEIHVAEFSPDWQAIPPPRRADFKNAPSFCRAERAYLGPSAFRARHGTNRNGANAFGKCVRANRARL